MQLQIKRFQELTLDELYAILKLRIAVFVVEQNCPYLEADGNDQEAIHLWLEDEEGIQAYLRVLDRGVKSEHVSIGRVISMKRRTGRGTQLLQEGIRAAEKFFGADKIYVESQVYAKGLYEKQGFRVVSDEFLDDGIPHVQMIRERE